MANSENVDLEHFVKLIWRSKIFLIGFLVIGMLIGYGITLVVKPVYKVEVNAYSNLLDNFHSGKVLQEINYHLDNKDYDALSKKMDIGEKYIHSLVEIKSRVSSLEKGYFNFDILLLNLDYTNQLLEGIQNYFRENDYNKKVYDAHQKQFDDIVQFGENELQKVNKVREGLINENAPYKYQGNIFEESFNIAKETEWNKLNAKLNEIIEIVNDPVKPIKPYFPKKILFVIGGAFLFLTFGLVIVVAKAIMSA